MPQMMPMKWTLILILIWTVSITLMIFLYFDVTQIIFLPNNGARGSIHAENILLPLLW
uniref:ATP synthase F0 subunit 8 n=1 Tax=Rediviva intermixta TaxID=1688786 RepID=A0A172CBA6_9HYME|nr:ATP synthase F0 subunit 8 [Rediviva intermixta]AKS40058.1 ATP synthase F0 subunit 8 [Rediviva intermixta]